MFDFHNQMGNTVDEKIDKLDVGATITNKNDLTYTQYSRPL